MSEPFRDIAGLDKTVHEAARLAILTALAACQSADFLFLERLTGLTKGNLSGHLSKLEAADLVVIEKQFIGKKPNTLVRLTEAGRQAIETHWQSLDALRTQAKHWKRPAE